MKDSNEIENRFFEANKELISSFKELNSENNQLKKEYSLLKLELEEVKKNKPKNELEKNNKFSISNLSKLNGEAVFDAINHFNKLCPYCKTDLYAGHIRNNYEIDHFYPIAKGGQDVPWNLLAICKNCNRKKRDKLPSDFLDQSVFDECTKYLENVLFRITNSHEDKVQRDEIVYNLLKSISHDKQEAYNFLQELKKLYGFEIDKINDNNQLDVNEIINLLKTNKDNLFGPDCGTYTTERKVANTIFKKTPTVDQKKVLKMVMRDLFKNCVVASNASYYTVKGCREVLDKN